MDPQAEFQEAPASPAQAPEIGGPGEGMSQEMMRSNLRGMMEQIKQKMGGVKAAKFGLDKQRAESKSVTLRNIYDYFESVGVDPSNPDEVRTYIEDMRSESPELAAQLEAYLQEALGAEEEGFVPSVDEGEPEGFDEGGFSSDNMNINNGQPIPEEV